jgi:hypothetical protein
MQVSLRFGRWLFLCCVLYFGLFLFPCALTVLRSTFESPCLAHAPSFKCMCVEMWELIN